MGFWFLSSFVGNLFSGYIGTFYTSMQDHSHFFGLCAGLAGLCSFGFLLVKRPVEKLLRASPNKNEYTTMIDGSDIELADVE